MPVLPGVNEWRADINSISAQRNELASPHHQSQPIFQPQQQQQQELGDTEKLKLQQEALFYKRQFEEMSKRYEELVVSMKRSREVENDDDGDDASGSGVYGGGDDGDDRNNGSPSGISAATAAAAAAAASNVTVQPPKKKPRPKDISKRMRDLYNDWRMKCPDLNLPVWDKVAEGYVHILSIPVLKAQVAPKDMRKMVNALCKYDADRLLGWCRMHFHLVDVLPETSLCAIKRLLTELEKTQEFAILSVVPDFIGHLGGMCQIKGVFFDERCCICDPSQMHIHIGLPLIKQEPAIISFASATQFRVLLPACPFEFPPGQKTLQVELTITIRNESKSIPFMYVLSELGALSELIDHGPDSAAHDNVQLGSQNPTAGGSGGSNMPQSSSSSTQTTTTTTTTTTPGAPSNSSPTGRQNALGQLELHRASFAGDLKRVDEILSETPDDVIVKDNFGRTPAHYAAFSVEKKILRHLLRAGGSKFSKDCWGRTPTDIYTFQATHFPLMRPSDINDLFGDDEMTCSDDEEDVDSPSSLQDQGNTPGLKSKPPLINTSSAVDSKIAANISEILKSQRAAQNLLTSPTDTSSLGSTNDLKRIVVDNKPQLRGRTNSSSETANKVTTTISNIVSPFMRISLSPSSKKSCPEDF